MNFNNNGKDKEPDIFVEDEEMGGYTNASENISIRSIALNQFNTCAREKTKEGNTECYIKSVDALYTILFPYVEEEQDIKDAIEEIESEVTEINKEYKDKIKSLEQQNKNVDWKSTMEYFNMRYLGEVVEKTENKLRLLSLLLKRLNYFGEEGATN